MSSSSIELVQAWNRGQQDAIEGKPSNAPDYAPIDWREMYDSGYGDYLDYQRDLCWSPGEDN